VASGINALIQSMAQQDFFSLVLPFILSYIVFFLAIKKIPLIKGNDQTKKFSGIISIIFALFVVYFLSINPQYQAFFPEYLGRITIGMIGLLGLATILAFIGFDNESYLKSPIIVLIIIIIVLSAWTISGGAFAFLPESALPVIGLSIADIGRLLFENGIIYIVLVGITLYWLSADHKEDDPDPADMLNKLIGND
jgi:hypothetical protein